MVLPAALVTGLGLSALIAFSIGANDMANSVAPLVGSGVMKYRYAVALFAASMMAGALVQGYMVIKTLGRGVVSELEPLGASVASLAAFAWIMLATVRGLPISTTHSMVGAILGVGTAYMLLDGRSVTVNFDVITRILMSWVLSPLCAMAVAIPLYYASRRLLARGGYAVLPAVAMAAFAAYSFGANDVGNAVGVYVAVTSRALGVPEPDTVRLLAAFAATFIALGGATMGRRVVNTLAYRVTRLDVTTSLAANADAIAVWLFTTVPYLLFGYGMPISTTFAAAGAIIGAGVAKHRSLKALNAKMLLFIMFAWLFTVPITFTMALSLYAAARWLAAPA